MDLQTLATCLGQAKADGWSGGAMVFQYPDADSCWIATVRADSWPVDDVCAGVAAWSSLVAYTGGEQVTYNGYLWSAKWWNEDDPPDDPADVWTQVAACGCSETPTPAASPGFTAIAAPLAPIPTSSKAVKSA